MTIIKNHFEVFILTSKWHGNAYRVKSWVIFNKGQFTHICQLNVSYGQDSVSGIVSKHVVNIYLMQSSNQNLPLSKEEGIWKRKIEV
jgi:hypothetical protein